MTSFKKIFAAFAVVLTVITFPTLAEDYKAGDITISNPVARATLPGQKVGGGYAVVNNTGSADDTLIGATADFAGMVEVHEMKMVDSVMKMNALPGGLPVPAGETVTLKPGGYHLMFMELKQPLAEGETHKVTLKFEKAGEVEIEFPVKSIAETMEMKHDHHKKKGGDS